MPLIEHLQELRRRLMWISIAVLAGGVAGWFVTPFILDGLSAPLAQDGRDGPSALNFVGVTSAFDVRIQISLMAGIVLTSPFWLYQIFAFLTPAFTRKEKKYVFGFFFSAVPLFVGGCLSGWVLIPHIVSLMISFAPGSTATLLDAKGYLEFALRLMLVIGVAFVLPVFLVLLNFAGLLAGKTILKGWRWAILTITIFTALATPAADVISMVLLAIPMVFLYFGAVGVAMVNDRRMARRRAAVLESADTL